MLRSPLITPPCLAATFPRIILPELLPEIKQLAIAQQSCEDCWIKRAGRAPFLIQHERSFASTINTGLEFAGESWRVDDFDLYDYPRTSPFNGYVTTMEPINGDRHNRLVLTWHCFKSSSRNDQGQPVERWAIASARRRGSITYGDCAGCPGCWSDMGLNAAPPPDPPKPPKWRGY